MSDPLTPARIEEMEARLNSGDWLSLKCADVAALIAEVKRLQAEKLPDNPPDELLMSMAIRYDHGLGMPGHYDQPIYASSGVTHEQRLRNTLSTMRQLYEEVVGKGFYRPAALEASDAE